MEPSTELSAAIAADAELGATAERLDKLFAAVDMQAVAAAVASGDVEQIAAVLGLSSDELLALGVELTARAESYAERFPELQSLTDTATATDQSVGDSHEI